MEKYNLKEALEIIAKHIKELAKTEKVKNDPLNHSEYALRMKSSGAVLGQTKSGKDIHSHPDHESHGKFSNKDHEDATKVHVDLGAKAKDDHARAYHNSAASKHRADASNMKHLNLAPGWDPHVN